MGALKTTRWLASACAVLGALSAIAAAAQSREEAQATLVRHAVSGAIVLLNGAQDGNWVMERPVTGVVSARECSTDFAAPKPTRLKGVDDPANHMGVGWGAVSEVIAEPDGVRFTAPWVGTLNFARMKVANATARAEVGAAIRALVQSCGGRAGPASSSTMATIAATPAWVRTSDGRKCLLNSRQTILHPFYKGQELTFDAWAQQFLSSPDEAVGFEVRYAQEGNAARITSAYLILPKEGVYTDGTSSLRVAVDGKTMPATKGTPQSRYGSVRLVQWSAEDAAHWHAALRGGKAMTVDFLDDGGRQLRSQTIDLEPIDGVATALQATRWTC